MKHHVWTSLLTGALGLAACGGSGDAAAPVATSSAAATVGAELLPPNEETSLDASLLRDASADTSSADLLPPA